MIFLSNNQNQNITPDLYNEGVKILADYVDLKIGVDSNDISNYMPLSLIWGSNYDENSN